MALWTEKQVESCSLPSHSLSTVHRDHKLYVTLNFSLVGGVLWHCCCFEWETHAAKKGDWSKIVGSELVFNENGDFITKVDNHILLKSGKFVSKTDDESLLKKARRLAEEVAARNRKGEKGDDTGTNIVEGAEDVEMKDADVQT